MRRHCCSGVTLTRRDAGKMTLSISAGDKMILVRTVENWLYEARVCRARDYAPDVTPAPLCVEAMPLAAQIRPGEHRLQTYGATDDQPTTTRRCCVRSTHSPVAVASLFKSNQITFYLLKAVDEQGQQGSKEHLQWPWSTYNDPIVPGRRNDEVLSPFFRGEGGTRGPKVKWCAVEYR